MEFFTADKYECEKGKCWCDLAESTRKSYMNRNKGNENVKKLYGYCDALYSQYMQEALNFLKKEAPVMFKQHDTSSYRYCDTTFNQLTFNSVLMVLEWFEGYDLKSTKPTYELQLTMRCNNPKFAFATDNIYLLEPVVIHSNDTYDKLVSALDYLFIPAMAYAKYGVITVAAD